MGSFGGFGSTQGSQATSISSAAFPLLAPNGTAEAPSYSFSSGPTDGFYWSGAGSIRITLGGAAYYQFNTSGITCFDNGVVLQLGDDVKLVRDAAAVLALKNGTTAQTFRVYGTTTGTKYATLAHDGSAAVFDVTGAGGYLKFSVGGTLTYFIQSTGMEANSNLRFSHGTSALATTATEGFFHLNTCAGAPTGVPASIPTGQVPMVFDTTNSRFYIYHGAAWHYIAQTA